MSGLESVLADAALNRADDFGSVDLVNVFWSVAHLRRDAPELVRLAPALLEVLADRVNETDVRGLSTVVWAIAILKTEAPCFDSVMPHVLMQIENNSDFLSEQDIANTVWACGVMGLEGDYVDTFLQAMIARAAQILPEFTFGGLANVCWGLALAEKADAGFMTRVKNEVIRLAPGLSDASAGADLATIAWAFFKLKFKSGEMLQVYEGREED